MVKPFKVTDKLLWNWVFTLES